MKNFNISQIQFQAKSTPLENAILLEKYFNSTKFYKPNLICTPECSNIITNDIKHLFKKATYLENCPILNMSKSFAKKNKVYINIGSLLLKKRNQKKLVNKSVFINNEGRIVKTYDKIHMFDVKISNKETHKESKSFSPGKKIVLSNINDLKVGFTICYDLRFPNLYREIAKKGAQIILIPAAFTVPTGKSHWQTLVRARAIENSLFIVATNMCGTHHSKRKTYGHSLICDPWGKIIKKASSKPKILNTTINLDMVKQVREKIPSILKS